MYINTNLGTRSNNRAHVASVGESGFSTHEMRVRTQPGALFKTTFSVLHRGLHIF
uniref:Uncharacterized protein n=1 Tax=Solanum tuberosum TaxID=4113 RepID=M1D655_SOLTU